MGWVPPQEVVTNVVREAMANAAAFLICFFITVYLKLSTKLTLYRYFYYRTDPRGLTYESFNVWLRKVKA